MVSSFICVLLVASLAQAQATDGNLVGVVTDMSGGVSAGRYGRYHKHGDAGQNADADW